MIIAKIGYQDDKGMFQFFLSNRERLWVSYDFYRQQNLHQGDELSPSALEALRGEHMRNAAFLLANRYVSYKPRTEQELARHLQQKGISQGEISFSIERLEKLGLLDDSAYGIQFGKEKSQNSHWSRNKIRRKLQERGLDPSEISRSLSQVSQEQEEENLRIAFEKSYRKRDLADYGQFQKTVAALARKGFALSDVLAFLKKERDHGQC